MTVIEYVSGKKVRVRFETGYECYARATHVRAGNVKDPFFRSVVGVGFIGIGAHKANAKGESAAAYACWVQMLTRCYAPANDTNRRRYAERGVSVCSEWHNFQTFADWFYANRVVGFHLDKDLTNPGCKLYSPATCAFVPCSINYLLSASNAARGEHPVGVCFNKKSQKYQANLKDGNGKSSHCGLFISADDAFSAYKKEKERVIRAVADAAFAKGQISSLIHQNLLAWQIVPYPA